MEEKTLQNILLISGLVLLGISCFAFLTLQAPQVSSGKPVTLEGFGGGVK